MLNSDRSAYTDHADILAAKPSAGRANVMVCQGSLAPAWHYRKDFQRLLRMVVRQASQSPSLFCLLDDVQLSRLLEF